jgi:hypothetical protein
MGRVKFDKKLKPVEIVSLGAGKQSIFMLIEGLKGKFCTKPDYAVFADTGDEPQYVYKQLSYLQKYCLDKFNFPISIVSGGNLQSDIIDYLNGKTTWAPTPPFWEKAGGNLRRACTERLKLRPVRKFIRKVTAGRPVNLWIGLSYNEIERMNKSDVQYINHFYPLIQNKILLTDIQEWYKKTGYPEPGKSSCITCPFHSLDYWRRLKIVEPDSYKSAIRFDERIRHYKKDAQQFYLHRNRVSIIDSENNNQLSLFPEMIEECTGLCGL